MSARKKTQRRSPKRPSGHELAEPTCYPKLVYHMVTTSRKAAHELDDLMAGRKDIWCDYAQSLSSWKAEQAASDNSWVDLRSVRDAARRLAVVLREYQP